MVTGGGSTDEGTVRLLGTVSSRSAASRAQSPAQEESGSSRGPNGTGSAVTGGRTTMDMGWVSGGSGEVCGRERERRER
ncbi:hypothetical protein ACLB2K_007113 [Fragaria x ananassa]